MPNRLLEASKRRDVVVMAGAGVSAGNPAALPGWEPLNSAIVHALTQRLEAALDRPGWLTHVAPNVDTVRKARFPPEYQAEVIEAMCGDRYFRALQSLDVDVINSSHDAIAALAAGGAVRAVITTNFDRLIEQALDRRSTAYRVAYDDERFVEAVTQIRSGSRDAIAVIKIHGCVSDHLSMIDTLKQRKRGRSRYIQACIDALADSYWLYVGFSAADLESDRDYLGLRRNAAHGPGATYVQFPRNPALRVGAKLLLDAYGERGLAVIADVAAYIAELCAALGMPGPDAIADDEARGLPRVHDKLETWANTLTPAAAALCLAAILEAIGQAEPAVRIMDRLIRKGLTDSERRGADFEALQLHYGRLGAAWSRFIAVPDLNGAQSNISVETTQSLLRVRDTASGFAASAWLAVLWLWHNQGEAATQLAVSLMNAFVGTQLAPPLPRSEEDLLDGWIAASQVFAVNIHEQPLQTVIQSADAALNRAIGAGDVVRAARVAALESLAYAETSEDLPALADRRTAIFAEAERVGDGLSLGMRALALGRWHVGAGGLALAQTAGSEHVAKVALGFLLEAASLFENQGMDAWRLYASIQTMKALADLHRFDECQELTNSVMREVERFPIFASHAFEAVAQIQLMIGDADTMPNISRAVQAAEHSGLHWRRETVLRFAEMVSRRAEPSPS